MGLGESGRVTDSFVADLYSFFVATEMVKGAGQVRQNLTVRLIRFSGELKHCGRLGVTAPRDQANAEVIEHEGIAGGTCRSPAMPGLGLFQSAEP